ncbi:hypothetical protein MM817_03064 [Acidibacillus sp. S0AB]|uniref:Uncharacterized protein n=1 Tax=Sulfoacidibacillus ferrooxidans TaxID=2005001 RepID=A0A9X2AFS7_9BACL|nr:hypothetical protein [Sulfoacidibacillus ferrooxidans]
MAENPERQKISFEANRVVTLGSNFHFWINDEDDIYDELYAKKAEAGPNLPDGSGISRSSQH